MGRAATTWLRASKSINIQKREIKGAAGSVGEREKREIVSNYVVVARIYVTGETRSTAALDSSLHVIQMSFWSPAPLPPTPACITMPAGR